MEAFWDHATWGTQKTQNNEPPVLPVCDNPLFPPLLGCHSYLGRIRDILLESVFLPMAEFQNCGHEFPFNAIISESDHQSTEKPSRVLLISDPQVRFAGGQEETSWLGSMRQFIYDLNLKKSWHVTTRLQPQVVLFLGDMLARGKSIKDEQK